MDTHDFEPSFTAWEKPPRYIGEKIEEVAQYVCKYKNTARIDNLNKYLERENCVGTRALLQTSQPIVTAKRQTASGIVTEPVVDAELLGGSSFDGVFKGCSSSEIEGMGVRMVYELEFTYGDRQVAVRAVTDTAELYFQFETVDETDSKQAVIDAFELLSSVDDPEYHQDVTDLREIYFDEPATQTDSLAAAGHLRALGVCSANLMARPTHGVDLARFEALNTILKESIDDSRNYLVSGLAMHSMRNDDGTVRLEAEHIRPPIHAEIVDMRYVGSFGTGAETTMQPAVVVFDLLHHREYTMPFQHLESLYETEHGSMSSEIAQSCGEWSHEATRLAVIGGVAWTGYLDDLHRRANFPLATRRRAWR